MSNATPTDPAKTSGLFGCPKQPTPTAPDTPTPAAQPAETPPATVADIPDSPQSLFVWLKDGMSLDRNDNRLLFGRCGLIAGQVKRLRKSVASLTNELSGSHARVSILEQALSGERTAPPTREELIGIVSRAMRDDGATEAGIKALMSVLERLMPSVFVDSEADNRPDPSAVIGYLCTFAGKSGSQIVTELGGPEFLADRLSDVLRVPVRIGSNPA